MAITDIFIERCRLLATLAVADDDVAPEELALLEHAMNRFGLRGADRVRAVQPMTEAESAAAVASLSAIERLAFLVELAELAWADGRVDAGELERIGKIAAAMGFGADDVERALAEAGPARV